MNTNLPNQTGGLEAIGTLTPPAGASTVSGEFSHARLVRPMAASASGRHCPHCHSIIYSRRHRLCGVCGQALPEDYLFSSEEAQRLEGILRSEQRRHRQWMTKSFNDAVRVVCGHR